MNYRIAVYLQVPIIRQSLNFVAQLCIYLIDPLNIFVECT